MAYGILHGGTVSLFDLYSFAEDIRRGQVSEPLSDEKGITLATQNGEGLLTVTALDQSSRSEVAEAIAEVKDEIMTALFTGQVALPLHLSNGEELGSRDGNALVAYRSL